MISQSRLRELDFYFYEDHRARRMTSIIGIGVGAVALLVCKGQQFSPTVSFAVTLLCLIISSSLRIMMYRAEPDRISAERRSHERLRVHSRRSIDIRTGPINVLSLPGLTRRAALAGIGVTAIIALIFFASLPETTEAAVVNRKLRRLTRSGRIDEAKEYANEAKNARIPIAADNIPLLSGVNLITADGVVNLQSAPVYTGGNSALLWLDSGDVLEIAIPYLYVPQGTYLITRSLATSFISTTGDGIGKSTLLFGPGADSNSRTLLVFDDDMKRDAAVFNASFRPSGVIESPTHFVSVQAQSKRLAMTHIKVEGMHQALDHILWVEMIFSGCTISCLGGSFKLYRVVFTDCQFEFAPGFPKKLQTLLTSRPGQPVDLEFP
jgi:hypothetical protein